MRLSEIASRLTGLGTPFFSVSWRPPVSEIAVARRVLGRLEDRRVLYDPYEVENSTHCVTSILEIRALLSDALDEGGIRDELKGMLRAMRAACRQFLGRIDLESGTMKNGVYLVFENREVSWRDPGLNQALGELRGKFSYLIAVMAARYGIDVEGPLATILPTDDN